MDPAQITASPMRRATFLLIGAAMLGLWCWSLVPPIQNWGNPYEDGFSYVGVFYATPICLPVGLLLLAGGISGRGPHLRRARPALWVGIGVLVLVVAFLIFQYIANTYPDLGLG
jgi:drug/metabolite transporter (DMT)-like permease